MSESTPYDVAIVGAGPAGSHLGYLLARSRIKVLIIEKKQLPRSKPCGGGLTRRAMELLPFDLSPVIEDYTRTAILSLNNAPLVQRTYSEPIIGMVMRDRLDHFLLEQATRAGCHCHTGSRFNNAIPHGGGLRMQTSAADIDTRILVGADGVNSAVASSLRLKMVGHRFHAMEGEVYCRSREDWAEFKGTVHFNFGVIPGGYGWIFPKKDHLSMGVLTSGAGKKLLKRYFRAYLRKKKIAAGARIERLRGHLIPWGGGRNSLIANRHGLLVGDAAGLTDPITGEGIFHALKQSRMAARVILEFIRNSNAGLMPYHRRMQRAYRREMFYACGMSLFLYNCEPLSHRILRNRGDLLAEQILQIITGQTTYLGLFSKLLHPKKIIQLLRQSNRTTS